MASVKHAQDFVAWLRKSGGQFNESLDFRIDPLSGLGVVATYPIAPGSRLISCPVSLAITAPVARQAIELICDTKVDWSERMLIAVYIVLHWLCPTETDLLRHRAYVDALPPIGSVITPLWYSPAEREGLRGTNLFGTVEEQEVERREEYRRVKEVVKGASWEQYLAATTFISSRAFPSKLLRVDASIGSESAPIGTGGEETSYPVLIPGLDLFNHARGTPITWLSSPVPTATGPIPSVSFISEKGVEAAMEAYNNYGPKSNEELLLSYGFVLDPNPDDTLSLKLGGDAAMKSELKERGLDMTELFVLRRDGVVPPALLQVLRAMIGGHLRDHTGHDHDDDDEEEEDVHMAHEKEMEELQLELDVLGTLGGMLEDKLERLSVTISGEGMRDEVKRMIDVYRQGQVDVLQKTQDTIANRIDRLEGMMDQGMGGCPCGC